MILSLKWLERYIKIDDAPESFAEKMTMSGSKIESFSCPGQEIQNVVAGEIVKIEPHPNAGKLTVCQIDIGSSQIQVVTGASNVSEGDLAPVALSGALLAGGKQIKSGELRGVKSEGMLCSLAELGLTKHDYPYAIEDGIFILREECAPGQDIREIGRAHV